MSENKIRIFCLFFFCFQFPISNLLASPDQFVYDPQGRRDPFIPLVTPDGRLLNLDAQPVKDSLNLEGIIYDEQGISYAIVNGIVVKIGDEIDGYQVLKIDRNKIIFIKEGSQFSMELKEEGK